MNDGQMCYGLIDLHKEKSAEKRIDMMRTMIMSKIRSNRPDIVVFEDVVLQRNAKTMKELAQLQGVIIGVCRSLDIPFIILYPSEWRKVLHFKQGGGIKRVELKQQAIDYVKNNYKVEAGEDESDAICIASAYISQINSLNGGN